MEHTKEDTYSWSAKLHTSGTTMITVYDENGQSIG